MHCAASNNNIEAIEELLEFTPPDSDLTPKCSPDLRSEFGQSLIHVACLMGHLDVVRYLQMLEGADMDCVDNDGNTVLHCVSASDSGELWSWVVESLMPKYYYLVNKKNSVCIIMY